MHPEFANLRETIQPLLVLLTPTLQDVWLPHNKLEKRLCDVTKGTDMFVRELAFAKHQVAANMRLKNAYRFSEKKSLARLASILLCIYFAEMQLTDEYFVWCYSLFEWIVNSVFTIFFLKHLWICGETVPLVPCLYLKWHISKLIPYKNKIMEFFGSNPFFSEHHRYRRLPPLDRNKADLVHL